MLDPIGKTTDSSYEIPLLDATRINPDSTFECFAYVRGGQHKFTKADKPFITLYLQDVNGVVIPGYVFDLRDFKAAGLELTKVIHSIVKLKASENYLKRYGMSVIVEDISIVSDATPDLTAAFVGKVGDTMELYNTLMQKLRSKLGIKVNLAYNMCTTSYMDFYQGRVGGQCLYYINMCNTLESVAAEMTPEESYRLFATFVLYIFVHTNYMAAVEEGNDDISLVNTLTASVSRFMQTLKAGAGAIEVIHMFFGYEPKDLFVRTVRAAAELNTRVMQELNAFRALPLSREGDAGYGTIKKYDA